MKDTTQKKIAVFYHNEFPSIDCPAISESKLRKTLANFSYEILTDIDSIKNKLTIDNFQLLILPFGSAFPTDAWETIYQFISSGGGFVNLGGSPFYQPVYCVKKDSVNYVWKIGTRQSSFAHKLLIGPSDEIKLNSSEKYKIQPVKESNWKEKDISFPSKVFELTVRFTWSRDFENEDGTTGPTDAVMRPLIHILDSNDVPVASPLVEIDRLRGHNAGSRWIFSTSDAELSISVIEKIIERALQGCVEFKAYPIKASIFIDEIPSFRIHLKNPRFEKSDSTQIKISILDENKKTIYVEKFYLHGTKDFQSDEIHLSKFKKPKPGLYTVEFTAQNVTWTPNTIKTGFWIYDKKLLSSASNITVSKDWLRVNDKVYPIIGTTYMSSDVHRKFLIEPNPFIWDRDFTEMSKHGINFVRTGIWSGWKRIMLDPGVIDESILRSLDAFVQTAVKHKILVCFTFFAFTPPAFGGINPYLDPRAIEGQKALIALIVKRYKNIGWIHYDLINEPSYSPPNALWQNRPIYDAYEQSYWIEFLKKRHNNDLVSLKDKWRLNSNDVFSLPNLDDLSYRYIREHRNPRKALDFNLFTNEIITKWADTLKNFIKSISEKSLVTLGQDEGGAGSRPSQQFHYTAIDYTCVHTWWQNDDLIWNAIASKVPEKPMLVQETGMMRLENIDGEHWRNPDDNAKLLDRKFAYAFMARGAGAVEWIWNINPYMPIDNESVIGIFRPDLTAKPELKVIQKFARFFLAAKTYLDDFRPEPIIILIPHTRFYQSRPYALDGVKRLYHILSEKFGVVPQVISDLKADKERLASAKLIILPTLEFINDSLAAILDSLKKEGKNILITGPIEGNEYGQITQAIQNLGITTQNKLLSYYEETNWSLSNDKTIINFPFNLREGLKKSSAEKLLSLDGNFWHEPLPLEFAKEDEALIALFKNVFNKCEIEYDLTDVPVSTRILKSETSTLIVCVNETNSDVEKKIKFDGTEIKFDVKADLSRLILVDNRTKKILVD
ncbi:MAG: cellulase family glycosylhydrolase, partial [Ignavibacteria bacterium]|nr:cellulase family glycosylhydrolase [Ignavibacteria bacterium]